FYFFYFFFQAEDGIRDRNVTGVQTCALPISGQKLVDISPKQRFAEMGFNMGLSETFQAQQINSLFEKYLPDQVDKHIRLTAQSRSEERRVGKECRSGGGPHPEKKKDEKEQK